MLEISESLRKERVGRQCPKQFEPYRSCRRDCRDRRRGRKWAAGVVRNHHRRAINKSQGRKSHWTAPTSRSSTPKESMAHGIGFIPEDRFSEGLVGPISRVGELDLGLSGSIRHSPKMGLLRPQTGINEFSQSSIESFEIKTPSADTVTSTLSGAETRRRSSLARELAHATRCILANQPSRGLDVGVIEYVHKCLCWKRKQRVLPSSWLPKNWKNFSISPTGSP